VKKTSLALRNTQVTIQNDGSVFQDLKQKHLPLPARHCLLLIYYAMRKIIAKLALDF